MEHGNILIIDDERVICEGCRLALLEKGHSMDICMTGKDGLATILEGEYDLVLLDMKLPDMEGMEILKTLGTGETRHVYHCHDGVFYGEKRRGGYEIGSF